MDTRTLLLDHAEAAVRARGFDGFSYADLAETVGIRKPSIHHHFPRKADLALALVERYVARLFARLAALDTREDRASDRLRALIGSFREALDGGSKLCLCVAFAAGRDSLDPAVLARVNAFHERVVDVFAACFAAGAADGSVAGVADPRAEAHAALALMEGAQLVARAAGRLELFDAATAGLRARLA
ncbi:MAG: TetR/AcrR family transcriptional regulator [Novosphingobium sp.]|nr:TetR/AcrR family transcriptional regulator [Novosphingobium sp.]